MNKAPVQPWAVGITGFLLVAAAAGYLISPGQMLSVVGISASAESAFLVQTLAAAFIAMVPMAWSVRRRTPGPVAAAVLRGLAVYMFAGSAVDLYAYSNGLVGFPALPSIGARTALGLVLAWLALP
ncbi:MAG: hypothetical protein ABL866_07195 [Devosia sp.]